jgi:CRP/FNR family transcriptional regulator
MTALQMEQLLALYPCLQGLPEEYAAPLSGLQVLHLAPGSTLFDEGSPCTGFPLVLAGEVRVVKVSAGGRGLYLYSVLAGESCVITQGCLLGQQHYNARGVTYSEVALCLLPQTMFDRLLAAHVPFRRYVFALFAERFAELIALIEEVAFKRLDQRLARLLVERGPVLNVTHQALADDLGSVREIVSRLLHHFAEDGWVELARERISVLDPLRLATFSEPGP